MFFRESDSGEIVIEEWKKLKHRELDWVEADIIKRHVIEQDNEEDQSAFIYEDQPYLRTYRYLFYLFTRAYYLMQSNLGLAFGSNTVFT